MKQGHDDWMLHSHDTQATQAYIGLDDMGEINITITIYITISLLICEIMGYVVQFVNCNELTGCLK